MPQKAHIAHGDEESEEEDVVTTYLRGNTMTGHFTEAKLNSEDED